MLYGFPVLIAILMVSTPIGLLIASVRASRTTNPITDAQGRLLRDLRISVTDRCNFRCVYCIPKEIFGRNFAFLPRDELLSFEEIATIARAAADYGIERLR